MWQSELVGGDLPMICAVTGQPADGWEQYDFFVDAQHTESDDEKFHGWLPVSAPVRRAQDRVAVYWLTSLALFAVGILSIIGSAYRPIRNLLDDQVWRDVGLVAGPGAAVMWLAGLVVQPLLLRNAPPPGGAGQGTVDGQLWVLVHPVHPDFAAAINALPRPRPSRD